MKSTTHTHPWGSSIELTKNQPSTVKILVVNPGEEFSLQYHKNREEFWHVLSGTPTIIIGNEEFTAREGDEFIVKKNDKHRISAKDTEVRILEISLGGFNEDDIVRIEDKYGRVNQ
ncbi:phosphomannose isomerase type II C-terminal cupin domain [Patescibacteria group bacterium]|nr:phosphomannose isomerase type II C-terminal cupin domain [Patescibacteria group bacterium]MBU2219192.1 phosphomannose isomerase type II C-terminal cupin domain [Patescibacteria group bacterium]MBU2263273.1 phosphomannose isomerase type II C-terminal cupin domain [Patescibacteria group bacterium]